MHLQGGALMANGITSLSRVPRYARGGDPSDSEDNVMTVKAEGVDIPLTSRQRSGIGRLNPFKLPGRFTRETMGGLGGLGVYEMLRDRLARGIENADLGPLRALGILPESWRESMANVLDESPLVADDLPNRVHDFAERIAAKAITDAGGNIPDSGVHVPYPTQEFAREHFKPGLVDRIAGQLVGVDKDSASAERIGFTDPSGWGATFGQGHLFEDDEGNIHMIDRYNFPNMTAGQVPGREEDTSTQFSDYARGLGPHDADQFSEDIKAFLTQEKKPMSTRATNVLRHYMSEFGSTETDPTEGRSWDINLGPKDELLAQYAQAIAPEEDKPGFLTKGLAALGNLFKREREPSVAQVGPSVADGTSVDAVATLKKKLADQGIPDLNMSELDIRKSNAEALRPDIVKVLNFDR